MCAFLSHKQSHNYGKAINHPPDKLRRTCGRAIAFTVVKHGAYGKITGYGKAHHHLQLLANKPF